MSEHPAIDQATLGSQSPSAQAAHIGVEAAISGQARAHELYMAGKSDAALTAQEWTTFHMSQPVIDRETGKPIPMGPTQYFIKNPDTGVVQPVTADPKMIMDGLHGKALEEDAQRASLPKTSRSLLGRLATNFLRKQK